ncbi:hypothetical protein ACTA71_004119 [Dictyostelium dimigraforme]
MNSILTPVFHKNSNKIDKCSKNKLDETIFREIIDFEEKGFNINQLSFGSSQLDISKADSVLSNSLLWKSKFILSISFEKLFSPILKLNTPKEIIQKHTNTTHNDNFELIENNNNNNNNK